MITTDNLRGKEPYGIVASGLAASGDFKIIRVNDNGTVVLSDTDIERIAQRVVELMKEQS